MLNIGLTQITMDQVGAGLKKLLADESYLYLKTLNFHWNVTGSNFMSLHQLLEDQYEWLKTTIDTIAERIRTLGFIAPATQREYARDANNVADGNENQTARAMLAELSKDHEAIICSIREFIGKFDNYNDYATEDMLTTWLGEHEKKLWMLRSHLMKQPEEN